MLEPPISSTGIEARIDTAHMQLGLLSYDAWSESIQVRPELQLHPDEKYKRPSLQ